MERDEKKENVGVGGEEEKIREGVSQIRPNWDVHRDQAVCVCVCVMGNINT